jgi:hypothetical protein
VNPARKAGAYVSTQEIQLEDSDRLQRGRFNENLKLMSTKFSGAVLCNVT